MSLFCPKYHYFAVENPIFVENSVESRWKTAYYSDISIILTWAFDFCLTCFIMSHRDIDKNIRRLEGVKVPAPIPRPLGGRESRQNYPAP